ncbi:hypothetical protein HIM_00757 [Hirsutella minnesotensis 3608]|nr:hypothetical protein HIM_00757 [Hirsutella minnesotensis 3608]
MLGQRPLFKNFISEVLRRADYEGKPGHGRRYKVLMDIKANSNPGKLNPVFLIFHIFLACLYLGPIGYYGWYISKTRHLEAGLIYSPARTAVSYELRVIDQSIRTPFHNGPSLETDAAWHELLQYNNIVVTDKDLKQLNRTSVALRHMPGYLAGLDVFHELHCLNYVRENVFAGYYALEAKRYRDEHLFHCIDHLREIIQCHGSVAVHTFEWHSDIRFPIIKQQTTHVCRKWDPILQWAKENYPYSKDGVILEHPRLATAAEKPLEGAAREADAGSGSNAGSDVSTDASAFTGSNAEAQADTKTDAEASMNADTGSNTSTDANTCIDTDSDVQAKRRNPFRPRPPYWVTSLLSGTSFKSQPAECPELQCCG